MSVAVLSQSKEAILSARMPLAFNPKQIDKRIASLRTYKPHSEDQVDAAVAYFLKGHIDEAESLLREITDNDEFCDDSRVFIIRGACFSVKRMYILANRDFKIAIDNHDEYSELAKILKAKNEVMGMHLKDAIKTINTILDPDAEAIFLKGLCYLCMNNTKAINQFKRAFAMHLQSGTEGNGSVYGIWMVFACQWLEQPCKIYQMLKKNIASDFAFFPHQELMLLADQLSVEQFMKKAEHKDQKLQHSLWAANYFLTAKRKRDAENYFEKAYRLGSDDPYVRTYCLVQMGIAKPSTRKWDATPVCITKVA